MRQAGTYYGINYQKGRTLIQEPITVSCRYDRDEIENRLRIGAMVKDPALATGYETHASAPTENKDLIEIQKNELVFLTKNKSRVSANTGISASSIPVLSSLNGCYKKLNTREARTQENKESRLETNIEFIGISMVDANNYTTKNARPVSTTTVQIAGLNSIVNTGTKRILAGELVAWEVPTPHDVQGRKNRTGMNPEKVLLQTVPYKVYQEGFLSTLQRLSDKTWDQVSRDQNVPVNMMKFIKGILFLAQLIMKNNGNDQAMEMDIGQVWNMHFGPSNDRQGPAPMKFLFNLVKTFMELQESFDRKIIGRATTSAIAGEDFDVYLQW